MKRKTIIVLLIISTLSMLAGCGRKAEPITLPDSGDVDSVSIETIGKTKEYYSETEQVGQIISVITNARATGKESVQDCPLSEEFGKIDISFDDKITTVFYYEQNDKYYVEQPYQGIYVTDTDLEALITGAE